VGWPVFNDGENMKAFNRLNASGTKFMLRELPQGKTEIVLKNDYKRIVVNHSIDKVIVAWYEWTMLNQNPFEFLSDEERQFLQTDIIKYEYERIFGKNQ
jgi:hypothetical protein